MNEPDQSDGHKLNDAEWATLKALANVVVPVSAKYDIPGAGDEAICKNVITDAGPRLPRLIDLLTTLDAMAMEQHNKAFADLEETTREATALAFRSTHERAARMIEMLVTQCYYRDDRVMLSLGMEARPPHPTGYVVAAGDWSSLDKVRLRAPFHRLV